MSPRAIPARWASLPYLATGAALLAAALWLRTPQLRYLVVSFAATAFAALAAAALSRRQRWHIAPALLVLGAFCASAAMEQHELRRVRREWPTYRREQITRGAAELGEELERARRALVATASRALDAPVGGPPAEAFSFLARINSDSSRRGVALFRNGVLDAWSGRTYIHTDLATAPLGALFNPFHVTLYAVANRGGSRAVATTVVHADAPADQLVTGVDAEVAHQRQLLGFGFLNPARATREDGIFQYSPSGVPLLFVRPDAPSQRQAELLVLQTTRERGVLLLALALMAFVAAVWRRERRFARRVAPLAVALACLAIAPLNTFSSATTFFDPLVYFADTGSPFTASIGGLALASGIVLLGLLLVPLARPRVPSRWLAALGVLLIMGGGPFLLRDLARGITPPPGGVKPELWLAWEVALFFTAACLLIAAAAAGSAALGRRRGLHPVVAPALALIAAITGPLVLEAPGRWPGWYPALWIAAIGALALTRRHYRLVMTAALVAALGSATLTWNAGVRGRSALADRDVAELDRVEPYVLAALSRFADRLGPEAGAPARTEAELLIRYVRSDFNGSGYPVLLAAWDSSATGETINVKANVSTARFDVTPETVAPVVAEARDTGRRQLRVILGWLGAFAVLAVPHGTGEVTVVVAGPRTRLIPDDPYRVLLGLESGERGSPPYALSFSEVESTEPLSSSETRWYREGSTLHGDRLVQTASGQLRAHIEVELRSADMLIQRGTLVVLLDLVLIVLLWLLSVLPNGALGRWMRARVRQWRSSYRARLTIALFAFFVIPAVTFATWSYARLRLEDRESRELQVRETLRAVAVSDNVGRLSEISKRVDTPLFLYRDGALVESSDSLYTMLAPAGRLLAPGVALDFKEGEQLYRSAIERVGETPTLWGYRLARAPLGSAVVIAAPARGNDDALDQRRGDLTVLVLFATVLGALAALWLSGVAARSLEQPIGRLRTAALAIAAGEREPPLSGSPPVEFAPVFSAFRRMAADLGESRAALEAAQSRISATLRNVASGVIAVDRRGLVTLANPRAETLLARPLAAGTPLPQSAPSELAERLRDFLMGSEDEQEFSLVVSDRQLQARLTRLTSAGGGEAPGGAVLTLDDVTDLARAQRVLAWGEMARQVAHEIKNPLTPIRLGVQHLRRAYGDARSDFPLVLDRNAERILAEIDRLDEIARSFSRYGGGPAVRLPDEPVDVAGIVRDVIELERLGSDGVSWSTAGATMPVYARARGDELREVLLNVLENARHARATSVEARVQEYSDRVVLEVRDNGDGIPERVLPRIFEPHFSTRTSGSGLGLAISRQLVEAWGGEIAIASSEGKGTTVRVALRRVAG